MLCRILFLAATRCSRPARSGRCPTRRQSAAATVAETSGVSYNDRNATLLQLRPSCVPRPLHLLRSRAEPESADLRYFRELVETRNYSLGQPVSPKITPDGKAVIFLRSGPRDPVLRLYEFVIAEAKLREILTPEKLLQGAEEKLTAEERS